MRLFNKVKECKSKKKTMLSVGEQRVLVAKVEDTESKFCGFKVLIPTIKTFSCVCTIPVHQRMKQKLWKIPALKYCIFCNYENVKVGL